jgi:hypothetical protein
MSSWWTRTRSRAAANGVGDGVRNGGLGTVQELLPHDLWHLVRPPRAVHDAAHTRPPVGAALWLGSTSGELGLEVEEEEAPPLNSSGAMGEGTTRRSTCVSGSATEQLLLVGVMANAFAASAAM